MKKYFISILIFLFISLYGKAQQGTFDSWSIGVNAGLYGVGIQGATSLLPNLKLRAGYDYFNFTQQNVAEFEVDVEYSGYNATASAELSEMELTLPNFKVMLDYYPVENGIFALTAGLYFGQNKATTNGLIRDYQQLSSQLGTTPDLRYEDIVISPNSDGSFYGELGMGSKIKPYVGIGLGRTIPHKRVGFKFELGVVNQGKFQLSSPNMNDAGNDWLNGLIDEMELPVSEQVLKLWPMLNFSLTYRIK